MGFLDSHRPICFYGGGAKVTQHNGITQYVPRSNDEQLHNFFFKNVKIFDFFCSWKKQKVHPLQKKFD